jgi:hypothetical protein
MSILIHGMELDGRPHKALLTERDGKPVLVVETQYSYADNEIRVYPVEEIPPHGRLIDADALCDGLVSNHPVVIHASTAPTIIPAEEVPGHE